MIGSIIGTALGIGSSIFGGIKASKAMKEMKRNIKQQQQENTAWYNRRYNEDATQRADAVAMYNRFREDLKQRNKYAQGAAAVSGATPEAVALQKAAANNALANVTSNIAAQGAARKDAIEGQYIQRKDNLQQQLNQGLANKANNISQATNAAGQALMQAGIAYDQAIPKVSSPQKPLWQAPNVTIKQPTMPDMFKPKSV